MATKKITALTELSSAADDDVIPVVDVSAGVTKKIQKSNLVTGGAGDVTGPDGCTDEHLAGYDDATGKLLKDSGLATTDVSDAVSKRHAATVWGTKEVDETAIGNGKVPVYRTSSGKYELEAQSGGGDVFGPATNTDSYIPQWNGADSKTLKNGIPTSTFAAADHDQQHITGGSDVIPVATTSKTGLCPVLDNNSAHYLNGQGSWATPSGGGSGGLGPGAIVYVDSTTIYAKNMLTGATIDSGTYNTDDNDVIQAAINAGLGNVYIMSGSYTNIHLTISSGVNIKGTSCTSCILAKKAGYDCITISSTANVSISSLKLHDVSGDGYALIKNSATDYMTIRDVEFHQTKLGIYIYNECYGHIIDGCKFTGTRASGTCIKCDSSGLGPGDIYITNCWLTGPEGNTAIGIHLVNAAAVYISGCEVFLFDKNIYIQTGSWGVNSVEIVNCCLDYGGSGLLYITGSKCSNVHVTGCWMTGTVTSGAPCLYSDATNATIFLTGCFIGKSARHAIYFTGSGSYIQITGCRIGTTGIIDTGDTYNAAIFINGGVANIVGCNISKNLYTQGTVTHTSYMKYAVVFAAGKTIYTGNYVDTTGITAAYSGSATSAAGNYPVHNKP